MDPLARLGVGNGNTRRRIKIPIKKGKGKGQKAQREPSNGGGPSLSVSEGLRQSRPQARGSFKGNRRNVSQTGKGRA